MNLVNTELRVVHIPQLSRGCFYVKVSNEREAYLIKEALANQHLYLLKNDIINDYSNAIFVEMFDDGAGEWVDYYNKSEDLDWDDFEETYEDYIKGINNN